jgi:WD40 repeat protein
MARPAFLFLLFALPAPAAEPPKLPSVEQLPDGALVRLGSPYFRHAGLSDFVWLDAGKSIATVGIDGVIRVWDAATGQRTKALILKSAAGGRAFAFSTDGKRVAVEFGTIAVHDTATGEVLATWKGRQDSTAQLAFAPDGRRLFIGRGRGQMTVWDSQAGTEKEIPVSIARWGTDSTYHGHFSPDGKRFVAGVQANQPLAVFDTATWEKVREHDCHAATSTFTPDGKRLVVGSLQNDGNREAVILVFDTDTGKELRRYPMGHNKIYFSLAVSPDGKTLACGASDRSCLLDLETGKVLHRLTGRPWGLAFSPDGKTFAASASGTHLRIWDVATGKERFDEIGNFGSDLATAVSPDGRLLAAAEWLDREIHLWDASTGKPVRRFPLRGSERYTRDVSFSPEGRAVTAGMYEGFAQVCEVATGKVLRYVELDRTAANVGSSSFVSVRVLPNRQRVATIERVYEGNQSTRVAVWDASTGRPTWVLSLPGLSNSRAWSADGETLAIALDAGVVLIDLDTGNERAKLEGSAPNNVFVTISADGRLVATARGGLKKEPQSVGVYEVATGRLVASIAARGDLAIARDNRTLFTATAKFIRAWDLATGKEMAKRTIPETWMDRVAHAPVTQIVPIAGRRVFTPLTDGTGLVWDFAPAPTTGGKPDEKQLDAWWADLRDEPAKAYAAVWRMAEASPEALVPFLGRHLRPEAPPDPARLRQLIADLNSNTFRVREKAAKELEDLGHAAAPALRKALAERPPAEAVQQIERLLVRKPDIANRPDQLRRLRAMQVLERLGTADARQILSDLAAGLPLAAETKEAQAALARITP